jgi:hypothetical protein
MNPKHLLVATAALALAAGAALAQSAAPAPAPGQAPRAAPAPPPPRAGPRADIGPRFRHDGARGRFMGRRGPRPSLEQLERRNADLFAKADVNRDGRLSFDEFRQERERRRVERQRVMFQRFSGGGDSVTLDQLNARTAERYNQRGAGRGAPPRERPAY